MTLEDSEKRRIVRETTGKGDLLSRTTWLDQLLLGRGEADVKQCSIRRLQAILAEESADRPRGNAALFGKTLRRERWIAEVFVNDLQRPDDH